MAESLNNSLRPQEADARVRLVMTSMVDALARTREELISRGPIPDYGTDLTEAVIERLATFYRTQESIKQMLGKKVMTSGADFFVETLVFFLSAYVESRGLQLDVAAERAVAQRRGAMRPDISIWRGNECLAFVECKTQLGWARHSWKAHFEERETRIRTDHPAANGFLVVMTAANWPGFGADERVGTQFFCLSKHWPGNESDRLDRTIVTPIEGLLRQVSLLAAR